MIFNDGVPMPAWRPIVPSNAPTREFAWVLGTFLFPSFTFRYSKLLATDAGAHCATSCFTLSWFVRGGLLVSACFGSIGFTCATVGGVFGGLNTIPGRITNGIFGTGTTGF